MYRNSHHRVRIISRCISHKVVFFGSVACDENVFRVHCWLFEQGIYRRHGNIMQWQCPDVIMDAMACKITSVTIVYSAVCSGVNQRKYQSPASLAFVRGIHRSPVNSLHKGPVTRKIFPFDDVIMKKLHDDVIKWKDFPRYWPFVRGNYRSRVNSPYKNACDTELWCFLRTAPEQMLNQRKETPMI